MTAAALQPIGLSDALHNLLRLFEREHQRIGDLEAKNADLVTQVERLTALVESEREIARRHRGRIDSLEMRMP